MIEPTQCEPVTRLEVQKGKGFEPNMRVTIGGKLIELKNRGGAEEQRSRGVKERRSRGA